jgi:hypothetical protein
MTSRHAERLDQSPLHDVRQLARPSTESKERANLISHERAFGVATVWRCESVTPAMPSGGARRDRTDDLLLAKQALSQLSYGPIRRSPPSLKLRRATFAVRRLARQPKRPWPRRLVGLGRLELPTSRLSSARSNQLSYKPVPGISDQ